MLSLHTAALKAGMSVVCTAFILTGCSTPAPIVTPEPTAQANASATPEPNGPNELGTSTDPKPTTKPKEGKWESSVSQTEAPHEATPTATPKPSGPPTTPTPTPAPASAIPTTFNFKQNAPAGSGCAVKQAFEAQGKPGDSEGMPDGWWVVMLASRAPEDSDPEKWKSFGFLVDLVCAYAPDHPAQAKASGGERADAEILAGRPYFSNTNGDLRWVPLADNAKFTCVDKTVGCAPGKFKRKWPQYPAGVVPVQERQWPVVAIRVADGKITHMEEIPIPNDPAPQASGPTPAPAIGEYQPNENTGQLPPGTLGAGN